eukprot:TRINITY_DN9695_c0_g1_i1.p1 TRINITY_DN9695_c0_g1~~TRINITY_DN9695_c0_g1_i1.p1  ORF type:complete len:180 (-),score=23.79 TRINITY_DN9695_c0_g1_i1:601-1140(-)
MTGPIEDLVVYYHNLPELTYCKEITLYKISPLNYDGVRVMVVPFVKYENFIDLYPEEYFEDECVADDYITPIIIHASIDGADPTQYKVDMKLWTNLRYITSTIMRIQAKRVILGYSNTNVKVLPITMTVSDMTGFMVELMNHMNNETYNSVLEDAERNGDITVDVTKSGCFSIRTIRCI